MEAHYSRAYWLINRRPLCRVASSERAVVDHQSRVNFVRGVGRAATCADVSRSDLRSVGTTGRRGRPAAGRRSGPGTESASWRRGEKQVSGLVASPSPFYTSNTQERTNTEERMWTLSEQRCSRRRRKAQDRKQTEKTRLTLQTAEVFRSLIISTNKLPQYCDPLQAGAKVRNAPPSSEYH